MQQKIKRRVLFGMGITTLSLAAPTSAAMYASRIEPGWIEVTNLALRLPELATQFDNYRIVQISDIHVDLMWMDQKRVEHIVQLVNALNPDLLVITGDFISGTANPAKMAAVAALGLLRARDGVFAVLGNHDHWGGPRWLRAVLRASGIHELKNSTQTIRRSNSSLHLVGLDDLLPDYTSIASIWSHRERLVRLMQSLPPDGAVILLVHEPDFADVAASVGGIALQLSGHSHGGQVRLPFYGPLALPDLGMRYPMGLYHISSMLHYTNRGIGMMSPLVRFNCRPEITVLTCRSPFISMPIHNHYPGDLYML